MVVARSAKRRAHGKAKEEAMAPAAKKAKVVNGVDVTAMADTVAAIKDNAEIAKFNFRATNKWLGGAKNRTTIKEFSGALDEHRDGVQAFIDPAMAHNDTRSLKIHFAGTENVDYWHTAQTAFV
jgi:hypothetical protein